MTPSLNFVMVANTCDDSSTDLCAKFVVESRGGSHTRFLLVTLFNMCMWWVPFPTDFPPTTEAMWISKSCDRAVTIDSKVDHFHSEWHAMCNGCDLLWCVPNLPLDSHVCGCDGKLSGCCKLSNFATWTDVIWVYIPQFPFIHFQVVFIHH